MRRILLLLCLALIVVCYGYPCIILPFGNYTTKIADETLSMRFTFDGEVKDEDGEVFAYYKLKGNKIIISNDKEFTDEDSTIKLSSAYEFSYLGGSFRNDIGMYSMIGVGVLMVLAIVTIPGRHE